MRQMKKTSGTSPLSFEGKPIVVGRKASKGRFVLCVALLVGLLTIADPVVAQDVLIYNHAGMRIKVCAYRSSHITWVFPLRCWTLEQGNTVGWNRGNDKFDFDIRVFKPGLIDQLLFESRNFHDVAHLKIKSTYAESIPRNPPPPPVRKYTLKVCNKQINESVYFSLAYEVTDHYVVQGWWAVDKGKCLDFPISEMMKEKRGVEYGTLFRTYFYARTFGKAPSFWSGTGSDPTFCIDRQGVFEAKTADLGLRRPPCKTENFELVKMRQAFNPEPGKANYYLSF